MAISKALLVVLVLAQFVAIHSEVIAIDAGSSGSRVYIVSNNNGVISDKKCGDQDSTALLANLIGGSDAQKTEFLTKVNAMAANCDTESKGKDIQSIILFSTAGSRDTINSKPELSQYKETKLNDALKRELRTNLKTVFTKISDATTVQVDVVSGRYEGIYGFVALYLNLKSDKDGLKTEICGTTELKACLDDIIYYEIGGSSSQIAFTNPVEDNTEVLKTKPKASPMPLLHRLKKEKKGIVQLEAKLQAVLGNNSQIYSRSFLGNGKNVFSKSAAEINKTCTDKVTEKVLLKDLDAAEIAKGQAAYTACVDAFNKIEYDNTKDQNEYASQWAQINKHLKKNNMRSKIIFNAGGSYFPISGGLNDSKKVYKYNGLTELRNELFQKGYCGLYNTKDSVGVCPGVAQPEYFLKQLKFDEKSSVQISIVNFSWLPGAVYLDSVVSNASEAFVSEKTNETENGKKTLKDKRRLQKKKAHKLK